MHTTLRLSGFVGGALALVGGIAALVVGGPDTVIVGAVSTVVAGAIVLAGTALAGARPGLGALLLILAVLLAGSVAPGVIPALADSALIFVSYLAGLGLLLVAAIVAFKQRNAVPSVSLMALHS